MSFAEKNNNNYVLISYQANGFINFFLFKKVEKCDRIVCVRASSWIYI